MILRKYMSLLGIGSAQIDLVLPKKTYKPGESINAYFLIKGGTIEQKVKRIDCDLVMINHSTGIEEVIDTAAILTSKMIHSEEKDKLSFAFKLPNSILVSTKDRSYRFETTLTFNEGVASKDEDMIRIIS